MNNDMIHFYDFTKIGKDSLKFNFAQYPDKIGIDDLYDNATAIIDTFDFYLVVDVLQYIFSYIVQYQISEECIIQMQRFLERVFCRYCCCNHFGKAVIDLFNSYEVFPYESLIMFNPSIVTQLCYYGSSSLHHKNIMLFYQKILSKFPDEGISMLNSQFFYSFQSKTEVETSYEVKIDDFVKELSIPILNCKDRMGNLISLYPLIDDYFLFRFSLCLFSNYSLSNQMMNLQLNDRRLIFSNIKSVFLEYEISFLKSLSFMVEDSYSYPQLNSFLFICFYFDCIENIEAFTSLMMSAWPNKDSQYSFLYSLYLNDHENKLLQLPSDADGSKYYIQSAMKDSISNYYIGNATFCEKLLEISCNKSESFRTFISCISRHSKVIALALLSLETIEKSDIVNNESTSLLRDIISHNMFAQAVPILWNVSHNYLLLILSKCIKAELRHLDQIASVLTEHLDDLFEFNDPVFVLKVLSTEKSLDLVNKYLITNHYSHRTSFIDSVMKTISEVPSYFPDNVLGMVFDHVGKNFHKYNYDDQYFIFSSYNTCIAQYPFIHRNHSISFEFNEEHIKKNTKDSAELLLSYVYRHISFDEFIQHIETIRSTKYTMFFIIITIFIRELAVTINHKYTHQRRLFHLIPFFIKKRYLTKHQCSQVFDIIKKILRTGASTHSFMIAIESLKMSIDYLKDYSLVIFEFIRESDLANLIPDEYKSIIEISKEVNQTLKSVVVKHLPRNKIQKRIESMTHPPPRVLRAFLEIKKDISLLDCVPDLFPDHFDWFALNTLFLLESKASLYLPILRVLQKPKSCLMKQSFIHAASFISLQHIMNPLFESPLEGRKRRSVLVLGKLIGTLTFSSRIPLKCHDIDLVKLLYYAFSQGKLYGTVPFVVAILIDCDPFFYPPNPIFANILQLLASFLEISTMKELIRHHILSLFNKLNIDPNSINTMHNLFPECIRNNFDFIIDPFSLSHLCKPDDIERIVNYDELAFMRFVVPFVKIPESRVLNRKPNLKASLGHIITSQAYILISKEASVQSKIAASTVYELYVKDFGNQIEKNTTPSVIEEMIGIVSTSLTMYSAPANISKILLMHIKKDTEDEEESAYFDRVCQLNYAWISQLLRDIICIKALRIVMELLGSRADMKRLSIENNAQKIIQIKQLFNDVEKNTGYEWFNSLILPLQPFPFYELQCAKADTVLLDPEFHRIIEKIQIMIPRETVKSKGAQIMTDISDSKEIIQRDISRNGSLRIYDIDSNRLLSIIRTLIVSSISMKNEINNKNIAFIFSEINNVVPRHVIESCEELFLVWLYRGSMDSYLFSELLRIGFVPSRIVDSFFSEILDHAPFNTYQAKYIINILHYILIVSKAVPPNEFVTTLGCLFALNSYIIKQVYSPTVFAQQEYRNLTELQEVYVKMEIQPSSDLFEREITFKGISPKNMNSNLLEAIAFFENTFKKGVISEKGAEIETIIHNILYRGLEFFEVIFLKSDEYLCHKIINFVSKYQKTSDDWINMPFSIATILRKNGTNRKFDFNKYYHLLCAIFESDTNNNYHILFVRVLYLVRPLVLPYFSYFWILLVTHKRLLIHLCNNEGGWDCLTRLVTDFIMTFHRIDEIDFPQSHQVLYRAFLRLLYIICHDCPDYICNNRSFLISIIPSTFYQIKNMINSVSTHNMNSYSITFSSCVPQNLREQIDSLYQDTENEILIGEICQYIDDQIQFQGFALRYLLEFTFRLETNIYSITSLLIKLLSSGSRDLQIQISSSLVDMITNDLDCLEIKIIEKLILESNNNEIVELIVLSLAQRLRFNGMIPKGIVYLCKKAFHPKSSIWKFKCIRCDQKIITFITEKYEQLEKKYPLN